MRKQRNIAAHGAGTGYHSVDAGTNLLGRLATWAAIPEDQPARRDLVDLLGRQCLVVAVVPFDEVGVDNCPFA
jgi:hypothetical protein